MSFGTKFMPFIAAITLGLGACGNPPDKELIKMDDVGRCEGPICVGLSNIYCKIIEGVVKEGVVTECKFDGIISGPAKVVDEYLREQKTGNCEGNICQEFIGTTCEQIGEIMYCRFEGTSKGTIN